MFVAGTDGRLTTADYLASIIESAGMRCVTISGHCYRVGDKEVSKDPTGTRLEPFWVRRVLRSMRWRRIEWAIIEVDAIDIAEYRLSGIDPQLVIVTNTVPHQLHYFKDAKEYRATLARLLKNRPDNIVLNADDEWFERLDSFPAAKHKMTFGTSQTANSRITKARLGAQHSQFELVVDGLTRLPLETSLAGQQNVYAAAAAVAAAYLLHINQDKLPHGIQALTRTREGAQIIRSNTSFKLFITNAPSLSSFKNDLQTIQGVTRGRLLIVLPAVRTKMQKRITLAAIEAGSLFYVVREGAVKSQDNDQTMQIFKEHRKLSKTQQLTSVSDAVEAALSIAKKGDSILVVGDWEVPWRVGADSGRVSDLETILSLLPQST